MIKLHDGGAYLVNGTTIVPEAEAAKAEAMTGKKVSKEEARKMVMKGSCTADDRIWYFEGS